LILWQPNKAERDILISKIIEVIEECFNIRNYNSFYFIYRALTNNISRVDYILENAKKKHKNFFNKMSPLFVSEKNDGEIKKLVDQSELPCIPCFHFYGKDLAELEKYNMLESSEEDKN